MLLKKLKIIRIKKNIVSVKDLLEKFIREVKIKDKKLLLKEYNKVWLVKIHTLEHPYKLKLI
jgi:hypothetical protein